MKANSGSAIIMVMIMAGVLALLTMFYVDSLNLFSRETSITANKTYRSISLQQIRTILSTTSALLESADYLPENNALAACIRGGSIGSCTKNCCQGGVNSDVWIVDPMDTTADVKSKRLFAAPASQPISYREDGSTCSPLITKCAYTLAARFVAHCPGGSPSCDHAEHIETTVTLTPDPSFPLVRQAELPYYYFPKINYQPSLPPFSDLTLTVGQSQTFDIVGDSGHPSEIQNFIFEKCLSSAPAIVQVTCLTFEKGALKITVQAVAAGTATVSLQINDRGDLNNLSEIQSFQVTVGP